MSIQRVALASARRERAQLLIAVAERTLSPMDVIEHALDHRHVAIRKIALRDLYLSTKMTPKEWRILERRLLRSLGLGTPAKPLTIAWLLDPRADGRRLIALHDALRARDAPWPGFPWTQNPAATT